jgi:hypothetical protein
MGNCCDFLKGHSSSSATTSSSSSSEQCVGFDKKYCSSNISITNKRLCAEGASSNVGTVLCDTPIDQLRAFWEFTVEELCPSSSDCEFSMGVMRRANLKPPPNDNNVLSTALGSDARSKCLSSKESGVTFAKGDVIGVALDMNYKR